MRPRLILHGLRVARPRQLRARALKPLRRRRLGAGSAPPFRPLEHLTELWSSQAFEPSVLSGAGPERLRAFHRHYSEEVLAAARSAETALAAEALRAWIEQHRPRPDDAWHPYTTSTRASNWIAAVSLRPELETRQVRESLWRQLNVVARNVEDDILGNHVIRNARALVLGGIAFDAPTLLERGLDLLERELPEQVLPDGGHYERSPVYHLIVLRDLTEVALASGHDVVSAVLPRMQAFAAALARPDGRPSQFNDGTLDLAPVLPLPEPPSGLALFPETGYAVIRTGALWLVFDCGPPSPPFLPAHAHADVLSFQLWIDGRPVVIDPGMPTYEPGAERNWFRGTRAHSTVAVDGDQFELWGAFRSGPLPLVELVEASERRLAAAVTGPSGVRHTRTIELGAGLLEVRDALEGNGDHDVVSSVLFAPRVDPRGEPLGLGTARIEERQVSERLYERVPTRALVTSSRLALPAEAGWRLPL